MVSQNVMILKPHLEIGINMAEKRFAKGSEEWQMFQDYWKLCQMLWEAETNDEYWKYAQNITDDFLKKYKSDFATDLALSMTRELQRKCNKLIKEQREHGKG